MNIIIIFNLLLIISHSVYGLCRKGYYYSKEEGQLCINNYFDYCGWGVYCVCLDCPKGDYLRGAGSVLSCPDNYERIHSSKYSYNFNVFLFS